MFQYENHTLSDIFLEGSNYIYSFICDYEYYVKTYGVITIDEFIQKWNCMSKKNFLCLKPHDIFYTPNGDMYEATSYAYESDFDDSYSISCVLSGTDEEEVFSSGDIYIAPIVHDDIRWKNKKIDKKGEKICPILITKTKQLQN